MTVVAVIRESLTVILIIKLFQWHICTNSVISGVSSAMLAMFAVQLTFMKINSCSEYVHIYLKFVFMVQVSSLTMKLSLVKQSMASPLKSSPALYPPQGNSKALLA